MEKPAGLGDVGRGRLQAYLVSFHEFGQGLRSRLLVSEHDKVLNPKVDAGRHDVADDESDDQWRAEMAATDLYGAVNNASADIGAGVLAPAPD